MSNNNNCPRCGGKLDCLGGCSAHPRNWYCADKACGWQAWGDEEKKIVPTDKYKHFNHHHEITDEQEFVDFGDGEFIANKKAIPLLKALSDLGIRTRTHHADNDGGFVGIILDKRITIEFHTVYERDSTREKYNGMSEAIIHWRNDV